MTLLTESQVRDRLRAAVRDAGSQRAWARQNGLLPSNVNDVLKGRQAPYRKLLDALGMKALRVYQRV